MINTHPINTCLIKTDRLRIRTAADAEMRILIEKEADDALKAAYGEMLELSLKNPDRRQWYAAWFIESPEGEHIGELCFKGLNKEGGTEIGYGILPEHQGCGYASEAVAAVTDWALTQDGVNYILAETEAGNTASQRVLQKSGFVSTGDTGDEEIIFVRRRRD
ncbi:MAG TPA: GNAT family N-acetyltransferase [Methanocorpusculum sp.]|nr:GNAT family N-acetyltransferase [Methanocorpusculum sp.]